MCIRDSPGTAGAGVRFSHDLCHRAGHRRAGPGLLCRAEGPGPVAPAAAAVSAGKRRLCDGAGSGPLISDWISIEPCHHVQMCIRDSLH